MQEVLVDKDDFFLPLGGNGPITFPASAIADAANEESSTPAPPAAEAAGGAGSVELLSTLSSSTICLTADELAAQHSIEYGDLPTTLWPLRKAQEDWWMSPNETTGQAYRDIYSRGFESPFRCIVIGTNGSFAFAFHAHDHEVKVPIPKVDQTQKLNTQQRATLQDTLYAAYAKNNPSFAYKWSTTQFERQAMFQSSSFSISQEIKTKEEAKAKNELLQSMCKVDLALVKPISMLGKTLSEAYRSLPETCEKREWKFQERPEGVADVKYRSPPPPPAAEAGEAGKEGPAPEAGALEGSAKDAPPPQAAAGSGGTVFSLMLIRSPLPKKATAWKLTDFKFHCEPKTAPIACFNSTHLFVLFQPADQLKICCRIFELSPQDGSGNYIKKHSEFEFDLPRDFGQRGLFNAAVGEKGELAVALASGVVFFPNPAARDWGKNEEAPAPAPAGGGGAGRVRKEYLLVKSAPSEGPAAAGAAAGAAGMTTTLTILSSLHHLAIGTENGECHIIDYTTDTVVMRMVTAAIEPLFSIHLSTHGKLVMHSVMNLSGSINPYNANPDVLELRRPVAVAGCGSLLFVLTKYGFVNVINCNTRNVYRIFEPPKEVFEVPSLQHAYKGIFVGPDYFVCVLHNGVVRRTELFKKPNVA